MTVATDVAFVSLFLLGHWKVETSRTPPWVASPCSCLPAVRGGFAVNKRLVHQRGGVIHSVTSSLMSHCVSVPVKYLRWSVMKSGLPTLNLANTLFFLICSRLFLRILLLRHISVFCHNVFQGEERRHGRMLVEGACLHWTAGCL